MPNDKNLKIQNFGRGRSVGQNDHYLRSYTTQKNFNNSGWTSTTVVFCELREL